MMCDDMYYLMTDEEIEKSHRCMMQMASVGTNRLRDAYYMQANNLNLFEWQHTCTTDYLNDRSIEIGSKSAVVLVLEAKENRGPLSGLIAIGTICGLLAPPTLPALFLKPRKDGLGTCFSENDLCVVFT